MLSMNIIEIGWEDRHYLECELGIEIRWKEETIMDATSLQLLYLIDMNIVLRPFFKKFSGVQSSRIY